MNTIDELLTNASTYGQSFSSGDLPLPRRSASRSSPAYFRGKIMRTPAKTVRVRDNP